MPQTPARLTYSHLPIGRWEKTLRAPRGTLMFAARRRLRSNHQFPPGVFKFASSVLALALTAAALWLLAGSGTVHACSCVMPGAPAEELKSHAAVFAGQVVSLSQPNRFGQAVSPSFAETGVEFQVNRVWKGDVGENTRITTPPTGGACGVPFVEGEEYLVYAYASAQEDGGYAANICSRTRPLSEAAEDLEALGEGNPPATGGPVSEPQASLVASPYLLIPVVSLVAALAVAGFFLLRRKTVRRH